ncbi:cell envelope integrity protein CreD [Chitinibacteraceae bacterium HSL-7]
MKPSIKIITCLALIVGLLVVLAMVRSLLGERQQRSESVREEVAQLSAGEQRVTGPFVVLPYEEKVVILRDITDATGTVIGTRWEEETHQRSWMAAPDTLNVDGKLAVETLRRGLFEAPVYHGAMALSGQFSLPALDALPQGQTSERVRVTVTTGQPYLALGISDARGIRELTGKAGGTLAFQPGSQLKSLGSGVHAPLSWDGRAARLPFALTLQLAGTTQLMLQPVGKENAVTLAGNWAHPSFSGQYAPISRSVTKEGFSASWRVSQLATGGQCSARECAVSFGVRLIDPVDRYVLNERTQKYAELFVLLIFGAVFVIEVMNRLNVHPVQYALVGLSLVMFFLLTLSLSEHMQFGLAYWIAALSSTALLGYYISFVLAGWQRGAMFAAILSALYGLLYGILQSEDMALLMGSLTLFALLALVMITTRKLDWGGLTAMPAAVSPDTRTLGG